MPSLRQQIHAYFDAQRLPAAKVDAILAATRLPEARPSPRKIIPWLRANRVLALAAAAAIFAGVAVWVLPPRPAPVPFAALAPSLISFFGPTSHLPLISQDKTELRAWLLAHGAPGSLKFPSTLLSLESFGCCVVEVHGRPAYLSCFWRTQNVAGAGGELIHLLAARSGDFTAAPAGREPQFRELDGWSFASWKEGDVLYTLAAAAPLEKVRPFLVAALPERAHPPFATLSF